MSSPFFPLSLPARKTTHPAFSLPNRPHVLTHYYRKDTQVREIRVSDGDSGPVIRLDGMAVEVTNQLNPEKPGASFRTDLEVREGQKVVVGKANMGGSDAALIVVITARLVS